MAPRPQLPQASLADRVAKLLADGQAALTVNQLALAQQSFEKAYRLKSDPSLLYWLGKVAEAQGQPIVAADFFRRYLDSGSTSTDEPTSEALRKQVSQLPPPVSEVTVAGLGGALLSVDGRLTGVLPLPRPLLLAPGPHRYRLEFRGTASESDPLSIPAGRTAELHLTAGSSGSLIAVLTLSSVGILSISASGLGDDKQRLVEESIVAAAKNEHTLILPADQLRALLATEPPGCLGDTPCLDRLAQAAEVRLLLRFSCKTPAKGPAPGSIELSAELVDLPSGLVAAQLEEVAVAENLGPALLSLTHRLFQAASSRPRGTLSIESSPAAATVIVDGLVMGKTPLERVTLAGSHTVSVDQSGFEPYQLQVTVAAGATAQLSAALVKKADTATPAPPPAPPSTIAAGESKGSRLARWLLGGLGVGAGLGLVGLGGSALSQNGRCGDNPPPASGQPCELLYNTAPIGGALLAAGIGLTAGGTLLMLFPGRQTKKAPPTPVIWRR